MNNVAEILIAVANSFGQAALLAVLVLFALAALPKINVTINAATRHVIWWAVLLVVLVLPFIPKRAVSLRVPSAVQPIRPAISPPARPEPPALMVVTAERAPRWPLWIAIIWAALFLYRMYQILRSYLHLRGVKLRASLAPRPLPVDVRSATLLISREVASPMAIGFLDPTVILPASLSDELQEPELEYVLLHETAHLVRFDDWSNLAVRFLAAVFCLNPVVLWILLLIEHEREIACDDWVVAYTGAPLPYAASLARMFELLWSRRGELLASGIFGARSRLGDRIEMILRRGRTFSPQASAARVVLCGIILLLFAAAGSRLPRWIAFAQTPAHISFEVASIKSGDPKDSRFGIIIRPGGRFVTTNANLHQLIGFAYDLRNDQISRGPGWVDSEPYSIEAKADQTSPVPSGPEGVARLREMLQALLADRFHLVAHREAKEELIYQLVVAKGGPKLKEAGGTPGPNGERVGRGAITGKAVPVSLLIRPLSEQLGRSILDKTGLTGKYDFTLKWTLEPGQFRGPGDPPLPPNAAPADPDGPNIFTALQEQLGLKLESAKGTVDLLVIDRAERPSGN